MTSLKEIKNAINTYLNEIETIKNEFDQLKANPDLFIFEYFLSIRTNIDIYAEEAIYSIQKSRFALIDEIKEYEKECLLNKANDLNQTLINNIENLIAQISLNYLNDDDNDLKNVEQCHNNILKDKKLIVNKVEKFKSDLIMEKNFIFIQKNVKSSSEYLFGDLLLTNFYTDNIENDLFRLTIDLIQYKILEFNAYCSKGRSFPNFWSTPFRFDAN